MWKAGSLSEAPVPNLKPLAAEKADMGHKVFRARGCRYCDKW